MNPKSKLSINGVWKTILTPIPSKKIVRITPMIAKNPIGTISFLISSSLNFRPDSKIRSGIKTNNIKLGALFTIKS